MMGGEYAATSMYILWLLSQEGTSYQLDTSFHDIIGVMPYEIDIHNVHS